MCTTDHPREIVRVWETLVALRDGIKLSNPNKILHTSLRHSIDKNSDRARRIRETFQKWTTLTCIVPLSYESLKIIFDSWVGQGQSLSPVVNIVTKVRMSVGN